MATASAFLIAACGTPDRIETAQGDTVIVNAKGPVTLPVRVLSAKGKPLARAPVHYALLQGRAAGVANDTVSCREKGDARIRMSSGPVHRDVTILCRPFRTIVFSAGTPLLEPLNLVLGAPPKPFSVGAYDEDRRPVTELAYGLEIMDTSIIVAKNGLLVPRGSGRTWVRVHIGDCIADIPVRVVDPISAAPAEDSPGRQPPTRRQKLCAQLVSW